jgi:Tol biopolymer transport system component
MKIRILLLCTLLALAVPALAGTGSIHSMVVGDKSVNLADVIQVTTSADGDAGSPRVSPDGKFMLYTVLSGDKKAPSSEQLRLQSLADGQTSVIFEGPTGVGRTEDQPVDTPVWQLIGTATWSPNSRAYVFPAACFTRTDTATTVENWLLVFGADGQRKAAIDLHADFPGDTTIWNRDGSQFAITLGSREDGTPRCRLCTIDVAHSAIQELASTKGSIRTLTPFKWSRDGATIQYLARITGQPETLKEISPDGKNDKMLVTGYDDHWISPDGMLRLMKNNPGLSVLNIQTGQAGGILKSSGYSDVTWSPNSRMFTYYTETSLSDDSGSRHKTVRCIWLAGIEPTKLNDMCVAIDADDNRVTQPSLSADSTILAYTSQRRLYVAKLEWRPMNVVEKLTLGRQLNEQDQEELKQLLLSQGKQLGLAALMYAQDNGDKMPNMDTAMQDMMPYLGNNADVLLFPGSDSKPAFTQVFEGTQSSLNEPAEQQLFTLDGGYDWQIVVYADGHARVVNK